MFDGYSGDLEAYGALTALVKVCEPFDSQWRLFDVCEWWVVAL